MKNKACLGIRSTSAQIDRVFTMEQYWDFSLYPDFVPYCIVTLVHIETSVNINKGPYWISISIILFYFGQWLINLNNVNDDVFDDVNDNVMNTDNNIKSDVVDK